jgi:uncharacterized protein YggU (UPF0235/DUF167 family)
MDLLRVRHRPGGWGHRPGWRSSRLPVVSFPVAPSARSRSRPATEADVARIPIRVNPGSRRPGVGGAHGDALVVRVAERAVDGRATEAALAAVADAFGVPRRSVALAHGATARTKLVEVELDPALVAERLAALLQG